MRQAKTKKTATIIPRNDHCLSRSQISANALKVLYRLHHANFSAYLVGGGVRDILLGRTPKDFDVVTDAHPEQVRKLFRNSRIIGRRFKLVHVVFGRDVIEVATFRGHHHDEDSRHSAADNHSGRILRDNVYGNIEEDAQRRDFTINAIYYNIADCSLHDFANGLKDIQQQKLRLIGNPDIRYREDPVRMLRAIRFAAKLDLTLDKKTAKSIDTLAPLLRDIPPARLFDESLKLLLGGCATHTWQMLKEYQLLSCLLPIADTYGIDTPAYQLITTGLRETDQRINCEKPTNPSFLYAMLLWPAIEETAQPHLEEMAYFEAYGLAANLVLGNQCKVIAIPKRITSDIRDIWLMQLHMEKTTRHQAMKLIELPKFRAGYDLLTLRAQIDKNLIKRQQWWQPWYEKTPKQYQATTKSEKPQHGKRRGKRRARVYPTKTS